VYLNRESRSGIVNSVEYLMVPVVVRGRGDVPISCVRVTLTIPQICGELAIIPCERQLVCSYKRN
jgi:hypothetical protein